MAADLLTLGKRIKAEREAQRLTQRALAELAQFEQTRLSKLESGKSDPGLPALERLIHALGKSMAWLLDEAEPVKAKGKQPPEAAELAQRWLLLNETDRAAVWRIVAALGRRDAPKD